MRDKPSDIDDITEAVEATERAYAEVMNTMVADLLDDRWRLRAARETIESLTHSLKEASRTKSSRKGTPNKK